jgi:hypothetical protein
VAADQLERQSRWRAVADWFFRSVPAAAIAGAAALVLVSSVGPWFRSPPVIHPVAVTLDLTRGDESTRARAPAGRPLLLALDLTGVTPLGSYQVRIVDARGAGVLDAAAKPDRGRLTLATSVQFVRGIYWVRIYDFATPQTPLREYELEIE